jgi:hypothetical protein
VTAQNPFNFFLTWIKKAEKAAEKPNGCDALHIIFDLNG